MRQKIWFNLTVISGFFLTMLAIVAMQQEILKRIEVQVAHHSSGIWSHSLSLLREIYTVEVVDKAVKFGMQAHHQYDSPHTIPLPATLTRKLGERLATEYKDLEARLYSPYPFPNPPLSPKINRSGTLESRLWQQLSSAADQPVITEIIETPQGKQFVYAVGDYMTPGCVGCHNSHPLSPKKDWKIGDLAGILEIRTALNPQLAGASATMLASATTIAVIVCCLCAALIIMYRRARHRLYRVQALNQQILAVSNHERRNNAHFLHDNLGQNLTAACFLHDHLQSVCSPMLQRTQDSQCMDQLGTTLRELLNQTRWLASSMHPGHGKPERKLETSLQEFLTKAKKQFGIRIQDQIDLPLIQQLTDLESQELYFLIVEAITNAAKHAPGCLVQIQFVGTAHLSQLNITSNFHQVPSTGKSAGIGRKIMASRAEGIGWNLKQDFSHRDKVVIRCYKKTLRHSPNDREQLEGFL